jgi:hypothetical protein
MLKALDLTDKKLFDINYILFFFVCLNSDVKSSSSLMSDLERDDSCACYLLEQIPHILTFKEVRI